MSYETAKEKLRRILGEDREAAPGLGPLEEIMENEQNIMITLNEGRRFPSIGYLQGTPSDKKRLVAGLSQNVRLNLDNWLTGTEVPKPVKGTFELLKEAEAGEVYLKQIFIF